MSVSIQKRHSNSACWLVRHNSSDCCFLRTNVSTPLTCKNSGSHIENCWEKRAALVLGLSYHHTSCCLFALPLSESLCQWRQVSFWFTHWLLFVKRGCIAKGHMEQDVSTLKNISNEFGWSFRNLFVYFLRISITDFMVQRLKNHSLPSLVSITIY